MKVLIIIGMLIIFISVFFILLTGDATLKSSLECAQEGGRSVCTFTGFTGPAVFGLVIMGFFILIDLLTVYLILTNIS